ncbi:hypothetical protein HHI36_019918 [Cryptolaemus montrouzieri]|uniref:Uncharacterized protein n=1 Tax=Cryptolaemus montrouzieri TaxID=559131 RepID=A0ABD2N9X1_9CUCU
MCKRSIKHSDIMKVEPIVPMNQIDGSEVKPKSLTSKLNFEEATEIRQTSTPNSTYIPKALISSEMETPKANVEFSRELKQVLHERNMLTTKTKKKVFEVLDEIEVTHKTEGVKRKKENAVFEVIVTEKNYVQQLCIIKNYFMRPAKEKKLLNNVDFEILFGNIPTIYMVNEALLKELYKGSLNVANAFLKIAPYFKLYSSYALEFKNALSLLQKLRIKNPDFYSFIEKQETRPEVQNKLSALLIAPIQRIPRYRLLLQQLHELSSPSDPDYQSILESLTKVELAAEHINKVIQDQENTQRLLEVQRCLKNGVPSIITPGRVLLKEGILLQFDGKTGPSEKFYVVLLSDIILFCTMKTHTPKPNSLKCKRIFPLNKCSIYENEEKGCFQVHCQGNDIVLYDRVVSVTKEWVKDIREAIQNYTENRKTLRKESSSRRPVKRKDMNEYNDIGLSPGVPLKRRRQTIKEDEERNKYRLSPRRSTRSMTPSLQKNTHPSLALHRNSESRTFNKLSASEKHAPLDDVQNTEVFVFGADNPNNSFTFKLTNFFSNLSSSVVNLFKFRR